MWGKDLLGGDGALDLTQSALLFLTFFILVLVGTLAAQVGMCMDGWPWLGRSVGRREGGVRGGLGRPNACASIDRLIDQSITHPVNHPTHTRAQIAGRAFDEAKQEALMMTGGAEDAGASGWGGAEQEEGDGWDWFTMLGIERPKVRARACVCVCEMMGGLVVSHADANT